VSITSVKTPKWRSEKRKTPQVKYISFPSLKHPDMGNYSAAFSDVK
jgi:hypothetical protein